VDASVLTSIAYVASFDLENCGSALKDNLYGVVEGSQQQVLQLGRVGTSSKFQVSWTEDVARATKGDHSISIYNEEQYNVLRKKVNQPEALAKLTLNHPGAYNGPWLNSEHLAAILGVAVVYIAVGSRSKLVSN
jgi:translocon-associated protein subunit delta